MALEFKLYRFQLAFLDDGFLNDFLGTTIHGGLGNTLKQSACTMGLPSVCDNCHIKHRCVYFVVYESRHIHDPYGADRPHPFTLRLNRRTPVRVLDNDILEFDILLVGRHCSDIYQIIAAFEELGRAGLGRMRVRFELESVFSLPDRKKIYAYGENSGTLIPKPDILAPDFSSTADACCITIESPLRLKIKGQLMREFDPVVFLSLARIRYESLCRNYGFGLEQELLPPVDDACFVNDKTFWYDQKRYSGRSGNRKIEYGGLMGSITLTDLSPEAVFYLKAGQILQVGKGTSCLLYTSPSPRDRTRSRMPSSA